MPPTNHLRPLTRSVRPPKSRHNLLRSFSSTATRSDSNQPSSSPTSPPSPQTLDAPIPPRWLSDLKSRIGKCITFGLEPADVHEAGLICQELARDWHELLAGSEGFLTSEGRRGLWRREVVWGEMDSMGHVNNVVYNIYAESARVNWCWNLATIIDPQHKAEWSELCTPKGIGLILRSIKTDFKFPMTYPDRVTVLHKLSAPPSPSTDSFTLDVLQLSEVHQRPVARCVEDIVVYDYKAARKAPLKPFMVDAFARIWREQEEAKRLWRERAGVLDRRVRDLETVSWDREGAVEKFGAG